MRSKFDIITELVAGVRGNRKHNIEAIAKQVHQEVAHQ